GGGRTLVVGARPRAGVGPEVEGFGGYLQESDRVGLLAGGDNLAVYLQHPVASLGNARAVIGIVEPYRVLARRERIRTLPAILGKDQHVVVEHRLAIEQVQPPPAPASAHG